MAFAGEFYGNGMESHILYSEGAPDYVVYDSIDPPKDLEIGRRRHPPPSDRLILSINVVVVNHSCLSAREADIPNDVNTTIQIIAAVLLGSRGEAIAPFLTSIGVHPDISSIILNEVCVEAVKLLQDPCNWLRLIYPMRIEIHDHMPVEKTTTQVLLDAMHTITDGIGELLDTINRGLHQGEFGGKKPRSNGAFDGQPDIEFDEAAATDLLWNELMDPTGGRRKGRNHKRITKVRNLKMEEDWS